ncbi:hypothetical protein [Motilimonas eburnea]|uniref:hypothetical protein n=1 Tax=Motilimonas eburnea TaxID=1737488 RepID=UPI001E2FE496|nr:hypothetical protein [Motilimonas eburnea]MCE2570457.1 hypothetical protein [Motilimonas eburnea]
MGARLQIGAMSILLLFSCLYELFLVRDHFDILTFTILLQSLKQIDTFYPITMSLLLVIACIKFARYLVGIGKKNNRTDHMARYITIRKLVSDLQDIQLKCRVGSTSNPIQISYQTAYIAKKMYPETLFGAKSTEKPVKPDMTFLNCQQILTTLENYYWLVVMLKERFSNFTYGYDEKEELLQTWQLMSNHFFSLKTILITSYWFKKTTRIEYELTCYGLAFTTLKEMEEMLDLHHQVYRPLLSMADQGETVRELEKYIDDIKNIHQEEKNKIDRVLHHDKYCESLKGREQIVAVL